MFVRKTVIKKNKKLGSVQNSTVTVITDMYYILEDSILEIYVGSTEMKLIYAIPTSSYHQNYLVRHLEAERFIT